jgi:hypothetical protein
MLLVRQLKTIDPRIWQQTSKLAAIEGVLAAAAPTTGRSASQLEVPQLPPSIVASIQYTAAHASIAATPFDRLPSPLQLQQPAVGGPSHVVEAVEALWHERTVGLQGNPSVDALDRKRGQSVAGRPPEWATMALFWA